MARKAKSNRPKEPSEVVQYWSDEIQDAKKREKDFVKEGERIIKIYGAEDNDQIPYNILFGNTETLLPALYSAVPRPVVQRRFKDDDPLGKAAATAGQRLLEFLLDTNIDGYETFDECMKNAVLDSLLPGRGIATVKYDAKVEGEEGAEEKTWEIVCTETRSWNRVYFGYARKWSKVPWIAYEEYIDKEEATRLFGTEISEQLTYSEGEDSDDEEGNHKTDTELQHLGKRKTCLIYQIWDKEGGRVIRWVSPSYPDGYMRVDDDPLQLTGFYNCPRPMQFVEKSNDLLPVALYTIYENQAKELNKLTIRINHIVQAIRARGIYDSELGDEIKTLMKAEDNDMIPSDKTSSLAAEKGLQNAIWFMPVEQLVNVLTQLYQAREQCKRVIYEITGISDIIRGSSVASETATAQNIKSQWGTMRLKRLQKEVQRYARDILRMMLEIAATKFSEETWEKMTGLPFLTSAKRAQVEQLGIAMQQAMQQGAQVDPNTQQQLQQAMSMPVWGKVLELLQDDMQRAYRIDIETNSTVEPEAVEDQKNIAELMNALAQYLNGVGPLVAKGVMPMEAAQSMLLAITRRFRFGTDIEDYIKQMKPPQPEGDGGKAEMAKMQAEQQMETQRMQAEAAQEQQRIQAEGQMKMMEMKAELAMEQMRMKAEKEAEIADLNAKSLAEAAKLNVQKQTEQMKAQIQRDTELKKAALQAAAQIEIAKINAAAQAATAAKDGEREAAESEQGAQSEAMMQAMMQTQEKLLANIAVKPQVTIQRDAAGRALKLVPQN